MVVFVPLSHREIGKQKNTIEKKLVVFFYKEVGGVPIANRIWPCEEGSKSWRFFYLFEREKEVGGVVTSLRGRKKLAMFYLFEREEEVGGVLPL